MRLIALFFNSGDPIPDHIIDYSKCGYVSRRIPNAQLRGFIHALTFRLDSGLAEKAEVKIIEENQQSFTWK